MILFANYVISDKYIKEETITLTGAGLIPIYDSDIINGIPSDERLQYDIRQQAQFYQCYLDEIKHTFKRGRLIVNRIKSGKATFELYLMYINSCDASIRLPAITYVYNFFTKEIKRYKMAETDMIRWEKCDEDKSNQLFYHPGTIIKLKNDKNKWIIIENNAHALNDNDFSNIYIIGKFDFDHGEQCTRSCHYLDIEEVTNKIGGLTL